MLVTVGFTKFLAGFADWQFETGNYDRNEALGRVTYAALIPLSFLSNALMVPLGVWFSVPAVLNLGLNRDLNGLAKDHLAFAEKVTSKPYKNLVRVINPNACFYSREKFCSDPDKYDRLYTSSNYWLVRNVSARLNYAGAAVATTIAVIANSVLGTIAATLSILCLGKSDDLNRFASANLTPLKVIPNLFVCAIKIINPEAQF